MFNSQFSIHEAFGEGGFTLLELLTVIAIIGILAAITVPNIHSFKPNVVAAATRQLLDDVARARQLAIANHTTVYMVFVPPNFWASPAYTSLTPQEKQKAATLSDKQLTSYAFVSTRSIGDQPGRPTPRYLSSWKTLPEGTFIPTNKFPPQTRSLDIYTNDTSGNKNLAYRILPFNVTNIIPFPSSQTKPYTRFQQYVPLPYIAFDYMGRLTSEMRDYEYIPLARGSVFYQRNSTNGLGTLTPPSPLESPPGNVTNAYTLVRIEKLTGRPHAEHQEVR